MEYQMVLACPAYPEAYYQPFLSWNLFEIGFYVSLYDTYYSIPVGSKS